MTWRAKGWIGEGKGKEGGKGGNTIQMITPCPSLFLEKSCDLICSMKNQKKGEGLVLGQKKKKREPRFL